jgi:hypothetical protein
LQKADFIVQYPQQVTGLIYFGTSASHHFNRFDRIMCSISSDEKINKFIGVANDSNTIVCQADDGFRYIGIYSGDNEFCVKPQKFKSKVVNEGVKKFVTSRSNNSGGYMIIKENGEVWYFGAIYDSNVIQEQEGCRDDFT